MIANTETQAAPAAKQKRERIAPVESSAGMEALVAEITALQIELAGVVAQMDERKAAHELTLAAKLRPLQLQAEEIAKRVKARLAKVEVFVTEHRDQLMPDKKKSFELPTAVVGFALNSKPKVVMTGADDDWTSVAHRLEAFTWGESYVRTPDPEVDKEALIADRESLSPKQLAAAGLRIEQPEKFYVQPKSQVAEKAKA
jgi:phage host-nuclease inhibitor protein Gam